MQRPWEKLTSKQRDVLKLLLDGLSVDDIARQLRVSRASVQRHVSRALATLREEEVPGGAGAAPVAPPDQQVTSLPDLLVFARALAHVRSGRGNPWSMVVVAGDPASSSVSLAMISPLSLVRASDRLATDGDFLAIVLPDTTLGGAEHLADRLRAAARQAMVYCGVGVAEGRDGESVADTYQRARRLAERSLLEVQARRITGRGGLDPL
jgi:AcrR family transcriptional regulator